LLVRIPDGRRVKTVATIVPARFQQRRDGDMLEVYLPRVGQYQAVMVKLE
jgi:hypothetical protein